MIALLVTLACAWAADRLEGPATAVDGDTLTIGVVRVRLHGIDAPEWDQTCWNGAGAPYACGHRVSQALADWLRGRHLSCVAVDTDRYGRTVARCYSGPDDVAAMLVRAGAAVAYTRYSEDYAADEAWARARMLGLWSGPFDPPEAWRHLDDDGKPARVREIETSLRSDPSGRSITPLR